MHYRRLGRSGPKVGALYVNSFELRPPLTAEVLSRIDAAVGDYGVSASLWRYE